jgi:sugar O-acyltransferase (sialic acid O-acetyltransferase NeuD family)
VKLLVYGSKDFGRLVRELVYRSGHEFVGFVDDVNPTGEGVVGDYAAAREKYAPGDGFGMAIAIGYKHLPARHRVWARVRADGYATPALVHPTAIIAPGTKIGEGSFVMAGANVDAFGEIGEICVLWPGAIVSHDARIGQNCFLSPGAILCGFVTLGSHCFLGAGSIIVDHKSVPEGAFVKAGALFK